MTTPTTANEFKADVGVVSNITRGDTLQVVSDNTNNGKRNLKPMLELSPTSHAGDTLQVVGDNTNNGKNM